MISSSSANPSPPPPPKASTSSTADGSGKKVRKPYTITKSRESWSEEEHDKFLEALQLFDRDWKKIEDFVGSKTVIQIRSHAQKYFLKVQKNGTSAHVPPPRPKRKAAHPYPQKATKNAGYASWDEAPLLTMSTMLPPQDELTTLRGNEGIGNGGFGNRTLPSSEMRNLGKQASILHGKPDFAEVYSFIGSVFDHDTEDHVHKLKEMDPINFETVLLLIRNLTMNLSSPDFEPIRNVLSSYDVKTKTVGIAAEMIPSNQTSGLSC